MCNLRSTSSSKKTVFLKERPYFGPRQIRTLRGLHVGQKVIQFGEGYGASNLLEIKSLDGASKTGSIKVITIGFDGGSKYYEENTSLIDHNIIPYDDSWPGPWNSTWCLVRTKANTEKGLRKTKQKNLIRIRRKKKKIEI